MADSFPMDHGVEPVLGISCVLHSSPGTIRLDKAVGTLDHISITTLVLSLVVSGIGVFHVVAEAVLRVGVILVDPGGDRGGDCRSDMDGGGVGSDNTMGSSVGTDNSVGGGVGGGNSMGGGVGGD